MDLGDRMKMYEKVETGQRFLPLLPIYARLDGKCFSSLTKPLKKPYDPKFVSVMVETTKFLVQETNACVGYTQSDEISLVWYSDNIESQIFLDGKKFKMMSILASLATSRFIQECGKELSFLTLNTIAFDCRVFQLPSLEEACNAVLWRELDATKNAISMACRHYYPHNEMYRKNGKEMQEMLFEIGVNFNDYSSFFKRGTFIQRRKKIKEFTEEELSKIPEKYRPTEPIERTIYEELEMPPFSKVCNRVGVVFNGEEPIMETV